MPAAGQLHGPPCEREGADPSSTDVDDAVPIHSARTELMTA